MLAVGTEVTWPNGSKAKIRSVSEGNGCMARGYYVRDYETGMSMFMPESCARVIMSFGENSNGQLMMRI